MEQQLFKILLLNTHQSHKAYCAWSFSCMQEPYNIWTSEQQSKKQFAAYDPDKPVTLKQGQGH